MRAKNGRAAYPRVARAQVESISQATRNHNSHGELRKTDSDTIDGDAT